MASSCELEKVLPALALAGVGLGVIIAKRMKVVDYFIKEHTSPKRDYINCLPDDILCHIISYLDMRDAARTSVLSRRWRNLYSTPPNRMFESHEIIEFLSLTERNNCHRTYKHRFVTAVLRLGFGLRRWLDYIVRNAYYDLDFIELVAVIVGGLGVMSIVVASICLHFALVRLGKDIEEAAQVFASALKESLTITRAANALKESLKESLSTTRAANALKESLKESSSIIGAHLLQAFEELSIESCDLDKAPFCPFS